MKAELMVKSTVVNDDRVNIEQSALEDGMAEFCKNFHFLIRYTQL